MQYKNKYLQRDAINLSVELRHIESYNGLAFCNFHQFSGTLSMSSKKIGKNSLKLSYNCLIVAQENYYSEIQCHILWKGHVIFIHKISNGIAVRLLQSRTHSLIDLVDAHTHIHKLGSNVKTQNPELTLCRLEYFLERRGRLREWERNLRQRSV